MVFYFTCSDSRFIIYMGRDKHENEHLIEYGWPEDLWFHVDKLSSAHVYLRLPTATMPIDEIPSEIVKECAALTKANSIEGCKLSSVPIVYTMWRNLRKDDSMKTGQVGFYSNSAVRRMTVEKEREMVNRLNKTKQEEHNDPSELAELKRERDAAEIATRKAAIKEMRGLQREQEERRLERAQEEKAKHEEYLGLFEVKAGAKKVTLLDVFGADDEWLTCDDEPCPDEIDLADADERPKIKLTALDDIFGGAAPPLSSKPSTTGPVRPAMPKEQRRAAYDALLRQLQPFYAVHAPEKSREDVQAVARKYCAGLEDRLQSMLQKKYGIDYLGATASFFPAQDDPFADHVTEPHQAVLGGDETDAGTETSGAVDLSALVQRNNELTARVEAHQKRVRASLAEADGAFDAGENHNSRSEEFMVLQACFSETECSIEENIMLDNVVSRVSFSIMGLDEHGVECAMTLRLGLPLAYPSHLPPTCEAVSGFGKGAQGDLAAVFVERSLQLLFFEGNASVFPRDPCLLAWVEWFRDESQSEFGRLRLGKDSEVRSRK